MPEQAVAYRQATLMGARGKVLAYAETVVIRFGPGSAGALGFTTVTFSPAVERGSDALHLPNVVITSGGKPRVRLRGVHIALLSGDELETTGEYACTAAIGQFRSHRLLGRARGGKR